MADRKNKQIKTGLHALFLLVFIVALNGCSKRAEEKKFSGATMGTTYHITLVNPSSEINLLDLQQDVDIRLAGLNKTFSTYDNDSELSRLNQAPLDQWIAVSPELLRVVAMALQISEQSGGAYDVTVGPLVELWGFGKRDVLSGIPPEAASLAHARDRVCYRCIELDKTGNRIRKIKKDIELDLSSIAKGYAVDEIADILYRRHIDNYMVEIGGEVVTRGVNASLEKWRLGIESPKSMVSPGADKIQQVVQVSGVAVATSGDYRNFMEINGKIYSHIIDPATGHPVVHNPASVTVIADNCALADGWATAFTVLGVEKGMEIARQQGLAVYFLSRNADQTFSVSMTDAFKPYLGAH